MPDVRLRSMMLGLAALCGSVAFAQHPSTPLAAPVKVNLDQLFEQIAIARKDRAPKTVKEFQDRLTAPDICGRIITHDSHEMCAILVYLFETPSGERLVRVAPVLFLETERITTGTLLEDHIWTDARKAYGLKDGSFGPLWLKDLFRKPVSGNDAKTSRPLKGDLKVVAVLGIEEAAALGIPRRYLARSGWSTAPG